MLRGKTDPPASGTTQARQVSLCLRAAPDPIWCREYSSDFLVLSEIFEQGEYRQVGDWGLPPDATVIDLGGNIGLATLYFSTLMPRMRAVVVEPDADNCRMIEHNCRRMIAEGRLQISQAFIAAEDGAAAIDRSGRSWAFKKGGPAEKGTEAIPCLSMQSIVKMSSFETIDLLKCDIEGSEQEVFADCAAWIGRVRHLIVETHDPYKPADLYRDLRKAGWDFELISENPSAHVVVSAMRRK